LYFDERLAMDAQRQPGPPRTAIRSSPGGYDPNSILVLVDEHDTVATALVRDIASDFKLISYDPYHIPGIEAAVTSWIQNELGFGNSLLG